MLLFTACSNQHLKPAQRAVYVSFNLQAVGIVSDCNLANAAAHVLEQVTASPRTLTNVRTAYASLLSAIWHTQWGIASFFFFQRTGGCLTTMSGSSSCC